MTDGFAHPCGGVSDKYMSQEEVFDLVSNCLNGLTFALGFIALFSPCLFG